MTTSVARLLSVAMVTMVMACGCQCGTNGEDTVMDHQQELLARLTAAPAGSDVAEIVTAALAAAKTVPAAQQDKIFTAAVKMADAANAFKVSLDAPLPVGWPLPSLAGLVRVKEYPSVRAAWVRDTGGNNNHLMTLLRLINGKSIPMTAPVVMAFPQQTAGPAGMAFLYANTAFGPGGTFGSVIVGDEAQLTVVSIGRWGGYTARARNKAATQLNHWLETHPQWRTAGPLRVLCYHSPFHFPWNKYSEIQIPVAPAK